MVSTPITAAERYKRMPARGHAASLVLGATRIEAEEADDWRDSRLADGYRAQAFAPLSGEMIVHGADAALAVVDGVKPRDETEALLACQMAASHALAMECLLRTRHTDSLQRFEANGNMATKFLRTFAVQMETLARVRRGGKQKVIVEHVHVYPGGKAAVGTFVQQQPGGGGGEFEIEGQAHAITGPDALALLTGSVRSENPERQPMPDVAGVRKEPLPDARRRTRKRAGRAVSRSIHVS